MTSYKTAGDVAPGASITFEGVTLQRIKGFDEWGRALFLGPGFILKSLDVSSVVNDLTFTEKPSIFKNFFGAIRGKK